MSTQSLTALHKSIESCERCPRLIRYCRKIAQAKRKAYLQDDYWGKPIAGFGDPNARLVIIGLAPAAHGANRTGRIFTGDRSGLWLYRALHKAGFSNQAESSGRDDPLRLKDAYISCVVRCAPPANKPLPTEITRCGEFLDEEFELLTRARIYLALGQIALNGAWPKLARRYGLPPSPKPRFGHGGKHELGSGAWLLMSYHPSQQNTFTGRLTEPMFDSVFSEAKRLIDKR